MMPPVKRLTIEDFGLTIAMHAKLKSEN